MNNPRWPATHVWSMSRSATLHSRVLTDRGVFSHGHLDTGTSLLLREAPPPASSGNLLDIGCGSGAIAMAIATRSPDAVVWAIDVNDRARQLTELNAARNGLRNIRVCAPDDIPGEIGLRRSGRTHRSVSASGRSMGCSCVGSPGSTTMAKPSSSCRSTSGQTRCSVGCNDWVTSPIEPRRS